MRLLRRRRQSALRPLWITSEMKSINGTAKPDRPRYQLIMLCLWTSLLRPGEEMRNKTLAKAFCQFRWLLPAT